jgi:hypothetical protein
MTVYVVNAADGGTLIQAGANDLRIIAAQFINTKSTADNGWIYVVTGSPSITGTTLVPLPAKSGAPASTATVRVAPSENVTGGTNRIVGMYVMNGSSTTLSSTEWKPTGDLVIPSGYVFRVFGGASAETVWYEELRLSWSY